MNPRKIAQKELMENGYIKKREGGNHMIWVYPKFCVNVLRECKQQKLV